MENKLSEGDLVICKVEKVTNTVTIVRLPNGKEGTLISSEIAPGRIKHMRHYVVPNKTIVCKILGVTGDHINLSLRRVNSKEKKEVMQKFKQEKALDTALNQQLENGSREIIENIKKDYKSLSDFATKAKKDEEIIKKYIPKEKTNAIKKIIDKKKKTQNLQYKIKVKCLESNGIKKIKDLFNIKNNKIKVTYISAGKFKLKLEVNDFKEGKKEMHKILEEIEEKAKESNCEFHATEER